MIRILFAATLLMGLYFQSSAQELIIPLYTGKVPNTKANSLQEKTERGNDGIERVSNVITPNLIVYRPAPDKVNGTSVIICPGGGYSILAIDHEGHQVARRFKEMGVTAFVLKYRLPNDASQNDKSIAPLQDAQQAFRVVRERAADFNLKPDQVGIMGFSAGGHLASTAGTHFARPVGEGAGNANVRPDFMILIYPVISFTDSLGHGGSRTNLLGKTPTPAQKRLYSNELQVTPRTPPTFLVHSGDDKGVKVQNSVQFYLACLRNGVPAEMHLYPKGGHGYGMDNKTTSDLWMDRLRNWMQANGWL